MITFETVAQRHMNFSLSKMPLLTSISGVEKLKQETKELAIEILVGNSRAKKAMEYADCLFCIIDSFSRAGFTTDEIVQYMDTKVGINENRQWQYDPNTGTYSHVKSITK